MCATQGPLGVATLSELKSLKTSLKLLFKLMVSEIQSLRKVVNVNPALQDEPLAGRVPSRAVWIPKTAPGSVVCFSEGQQPWIAGNRK